MMNYLRVFLSAILCVAALGCRAQAPQSGTYLIKGANGKYVEIKGKYYAKPDASAATDYTTIGLGVGYATDGGYRVYSLTGTNPADGSSIEVYDYIQKAYAIVSQFAQDKLNGKLNAIFGETSGDEGDDSSDDSNNDESNEPTTQEVIEAIDAMADSICKIYTADYAYMTLVPEGHYGSKWVVRAKATVPAIPYTIKAVGDHFVKGHVVYGDHQCTDVWDWAKQHVLKYLAEHQTDWTLQQLVKKYLDQVEPGTTYYLTCEDNETFGYETTPTDNGLWTMEAISTKADGLAPATVNIQNQSTQYYVNVTGKYDAEPNLSATDIQGSDANKKNAAIDLNFGRYDRTNPDLYRITELSNQGRDVVAYISKGMAKAFGIVDQKMQSSEYYAKIAERLNSALGDDSSDGSNSAKVTADEVRADVQTAFDLCTQYYAYLNLVDNGDQTVSLYVDVPQVPALLDIATQALKEKSFETIVKEQLDKYFSDASSSTDTHLRQLWQQNRDKWHFGHRYYLSAEAPTRTFEFTESASDEATKWLLADIAASDSKTNPYRGYFRVKNLGGYTAEGNSEPQRYVEVRGRATADAAVTNSEKYTKAGTVVYINLDTNAKDIAAVGDASRTTKGYEVLNLRSQGIDITNGTKADTTGLQEIFGNLLDDDGDISSAYNGYMGLARYILYYAAKLGSSHIAAHATDYPQIATQQECQQILDDFIANYLPELRMPIYMIPAEGKDGSYYIRSQVPSLAPIADFYKTNKQAMDSIVIPTMRRFLEYQNNNGQYLDKIGYTGEKFSYEDEGTVRRWNGDTFGLWDYAEKDASGQPLRDADGNYSLPYSTILGNEWVMFNWLKLQAWHALEKMGKTSDSKLMRYLAMVHYDTPYYLIQGSNTDAEGKRNYTPGASLGFANDATVSDTYNDLLGAGDNACWTLEPVDADNYFAVKPNSNRGRNGKYYAATYLDFPFQLTGSNATAAYTIEGNEVKDGTDEATSETYKYVLFAQQQGTVAAATPVIIETSQSNVDKEIALVPVVSGERSEKNGLVQGTFFGGLHNVVQNDDSSDEGGIMSVLRAMKDQLLNGSIQTKYGVDTDDMDLYLFGYNKRNTANPYGFILYSKAGETDSRWNNIPGNKPFLLQGPAQEDNGAKVRVRFAFDDETTGISDISADNAGNTGNTAAENAAAYNLAGQRVTKAYKGVVVTNGRKVIKK